MYLTTTDKLFNDLWYPNLFNNSFYHAEREDGDLKIYFDFPGLSKADLTINVIDNILQIDGPEKVDSDRLKRYEGISMKYKLPSDLNHTEMKAKFKNGVLVIKIPKNEEIRKKIEIT